MCAGMCGYDLSDAQSKPKVVHAVPLCEDLNAAPVAAVGWHDGASHLTVSIL